MSGAKFRPQSFLDTVHHQGIDSDTTVVTATAMRLPLLLTDDWNAQKSGQF